MRLRLFIVVFYLIWGSCCISVQKFIYPLIKVTLWLKNVILFFDCDKRKKKNPEIWLYRMVHAFLVIIYQLSCRLHLSGLSYVNKSSRFKTLFWVLCYCVCNRKIVTIGLPHWGKIYTEKLKQLTRKTSHNFLTLFSRYFHVWNAKSP